MIKQLYFVCLLLIGPFLLSAQPGLQFSRVKIRLAEHTVADVARLGLEASPGHISPGHFIINDYSETEIALLEANGFDYEILIPDVKAWYVNQSAETQAMDFRNNGCGASPSYDYTTPANYQPGTLAGYFRYDEMMAELDRMAEMYPNLLSARAPIGNIVSHEGHSIYWLRLSDNPNTDEDEPEVLYTSLHHAREPNSLSQMIFYLWYLLENYETDDEVRYLVDNTEMYFIPCVNPDGYIYNETADPMGGGLWRKNRWADENGVVYGVDLNRNYGYEWGIDNTGSSPNPESQVFRGPGPFSEPELQAVKLFCEQHEFQIALNYHTFGNLLIHPWGYNDTPTSEDALFKALGRVMTQENDFTLGTGTETVGYVANGVSDDWMYGETETKAPIYAFTPEVGPGNFGFWPPASAIDELNKSALWKNLAAAHLLLNYVVANSVEEGYITATAGTDELLLEQYGLLPGPANISVSAGSPNVTVAPNEADYELANLESALHSYSYTIEPGDELLEEVRFLVRIDNGEYVREETITRVYLNSIFEVVFEDDLSDDSNWFNFGEWGLTNTSFVTAPNAMTDSPSGNYEDNTESVLGLSGIVDLSEGGAAFLRYWARWSIEDGWDYAQVLASSDGINFVPLCGQYTNPGTGGFQPDGDPLYDGTQDEWVREEIDLSDYLGQEQVHIRFYFRSDGFVNLDGFYFDDLEVVILDEVISSTEALAGQALAELTVAPNPFRDQLAAEWVLNQAAEQVQVRLTDALGAECANQAISTPQASFRHRTELSTKQLPAGFYYLQLYADGQLMQTQKVVKL